MRGSPRNSSVCHPDEAEKNLAGGAEDLTRVLQATGSCVYATDRTLRLTRITGDTQAILGFASLDLIGKHFGEFLEFEPGEDDRATLEKRAPLGKVRCRTRDKTRYLQISGVPLDDGEGEFAGYHGVISDATALVEAEERAAAQYRRFNEAIECIPASLMLFDADDRLVLCNSATQDFFPGAKDLLVPGTTFEELLRADIVSGHLWKTDMSVDDWIAERVASHRAANLDVIGERPDGRWIEVIERSTTDGGVIGIRVDVTELKQKEAELEEKTRQLEARGEELVVAKEAAEAADGAKTRFLANMSHELRTPLNAIIGFSSMIAMEVRGPLNPEVYKEYANDINHSGTHLLGVINDILDLSKIAAGRVDIEPADVRLPALIEDCVHMVRMKAEAAGLELIVDVPHDVPSLSGDERMVKRMLINLLSNAVKFTEQGHVRVTAHQARDGALALSVADTGIGIAAENLPRLMRPFMQVDATISRKHEGTGLGLSLVKSMVELHGGEIVIESALGSGTTVTLHFPAGRTIGHVAAPVAALAAG
jgi:two-component system, cell cycle sensor histidine kinase PleC